MDPETHGRIVCHLQADPVVLQVIDPKSEEMGDGVYRFKAEIRELVEKYVGMRK